MPIVDAKVGAAGPLIWRDVRARLWRQQVSYYRHSVLIVVADESLVRIRCVGSDNPRALARGLGRIVVGNYDFVSWLDAKATLVMHIVRDLLHVAEACCRCRCHCVPDVAAVGLDVALTTGADANAFRQGRGWRSCRLVRLGSSMSPATPVQARH